MSRTFSKTLGGGILTLYAFIVAAPLYFVAASAFKGSVGFFANPLGLPRPFTLDNFTGVLQGQPMLRYFLNTVLVTAGTLMSALLLGSLISYAIFRLGGRSGSVLFSLFAAGLIVPSQVNMLPLYALVRQVGGSDRLFSLVIVSAATLLPLTVFMLTGFMKLLSRELMEAGCLDGCREWTLFWRIALPLTAPSIAATAAFLLVIVWNDLLMPMLLLSSKSKLTLPLALLEFRGEYVTNYPMLLAGILITALPLAIVFVLLQPYFVTGLTEGALKG
ncbi:L-arabinose transport system permease protein AraQ [compost metagenome]